MILGFGRRGRQLRANFARRGTGHHVEICYMRAVIGDPIDELVSGFPKLFRGHKSSFRDASMVIPAFQRGALEFNPALIKAIEHLDARR